MREALVEAEKALLRGDRPIGTVIVRDGQVVAGGSNTFRTDRSHIAHAKAQLLTDLRRTCAPEQAADCTGDIGVKSSFVWVGTIRTDSARLCGC